MKSIKIPYEDLGRLHAPIKELLKEAFRKTLEKGRFILGEEVEAFEETLAKSVKRKYAIGLSSGTAALTLLLRAMQQSNERREVIVPAMVCMPVVAAVIEAGCKPVFADISPGRYTLDPDLVEKFMNERVLAVISVHLYGHVCHLSRLQEICKRYGAFLLEDCAQAQGAYWKGMPVGSIGDAAAFSFYPTKHLGALGDAGAAVTDREDWAVYIRNAREYGSAARGPYHQLSSNYRMDTLQAAFLLAKWPFVDEWISRKNLIAQTYLRELNHLELTLPEPMEEANDAKHVFPVLHANRDELRRVLLSNGIETAVHYHYVAAFQPVFSHYHSSQFKVSMRVAEEQFSLPFSPTLIEAELETVIWAITSNINSK